MKIVNVCLVTLALLAGHAVAGACSNSPTGGACSNLILQYAQFREDGVVEIRLQNRNNPEPVDSVILLDATRVGQFRFSGMYPLIQSALSAKLNVWLSYTTKNGKKYLDEISAFQPDIGM